MFSLPQKHIDIILEFAEYESSKIKNEWFIENHNDISELITLGYIFLTKAGYAIPLRLTDLGIARKNYEISLRKLNELEEKQINKY